MEWVKDVQTALTNAGFALVIDGLVGRHTKSAIKKFQKNIGLIADGIIGTKTLNKLYPYMTGLKTYYC